MQKNTIYMTYTCYGVRSTKSVVVFIIHFMNNYVNSCKSPHHLCVQWKIFSTFLRFTIPITVARKRDMHACRLVHACRRKNRYINACMHGRNVQSNDGVFFFKFNATSIKQRCRVTSHSQYCIWNAYGWNPIFCTCLNVTERNHAVYIIPRVKHIQLNR